MGYKLSSVKQFATDIMKQIPPLMQLRAPDHNHWSSHEKALKRSQQAYELAPDNPVLLHQYASALLNAANYLLKKEEKGTRPTSERLAIIDQHTDFIYNKAKSKYTISLPETGTVKQPDLSRMGPAQRLAEGVIAERAVKKEAAQILRSQVKGVLGAAVQVMSDGGNPEACRNLKQGLREMVHTATRVVETKEKNVSLFLNSEEFKAFKNYRDSLKTDSRNHSFMGTNLDLHQQKFQIMDNLVKQLESQTQMAGVHKILNEFAEGKGNTISKDGGKTYNKSEYEVLNTGQNITTFVLGSMGLKNTTSINRFEGLLKAADKIQPIEEQRSSLDFN